MAKKNPKWKIKLETGEVKTTPDGFEVRLMAEVFMNGKSQGGCDVSFSQGITRLAGGSTGGNGVITFIYRAPLSEAGKRVKINARIDERDVRDNVEISFPAAPRKKGLAGIKEDLLSRKVSIITDIVKAVVLGGGCLDPP